MNKIQEIKMLLNGLAEYYRTNLTAAQLAMYSEDLEDLTMDQIASAIKKIRMDKSEKFFPLPARIRELAIPGVDEDGEAREAAAAIVTAMIRFGSPNADRARAFMGEVAWAVVQMEGGWSHLCSTVQNDELAILKAQWRELAKVARARLIQNASKALTGPADSIKLIDGMVKQAIERPTVDITQIKPGMITRGESNGGQ